MTQVSLKMAESIGTKVIVWKGKHLRIHSTLGSCWSPQLYQLRAGPYLWLGVM